jgi:hypothetical protein
MNELLEILEERRSQCAGIFERLLAAPAFEFDCSLELRLPAEQGLYLIAQRQGPRSLYLHAGKTRNAKLGLRSRVWIQHYNGGGKGAGSDLLQKVIDNGQATGRTDAKAWIRANCLVQWAVEEDEVLRGWTEHYLLSVLRPIWGS